MSALIPFTYQGSKLAELKHLSEFIKPNSRIIEPFMGTGIVSYKFGQDKGCLGNDYSVDIHNIWVNSQDKKFHSLALEYMNEDNRTEEFYYNMRSIYNSIYWNTNVFGVERAVLFYYLINSCHAGQVRYGKKGFNMPIKLFLLNGRKYNASDRLTLLSKVSSKFTNFSCLDALEFLKLNEDYLSEYDVIYCDPPYTDSTGRYMGTWTNDNLQELDDYLFHVALNKGVYSVMSNYSHKEFIFKGTIAKTFEKTRMSATKLTVSENIILTYGR